MGNPLNIEQFLIQFFTSHHCEIQKQEAGKMTVQLTIDMDKALMNRPFYWQYVESTGNIGKPKQLTFITDPKKADEGEWIHFGSPRLEQIYQYLSKTSKFIHLYENVEVMNNTMLQPWLLTNICIMYEGKQKKEELLSIGLNLINGTFLFDMMQRLEKIQLKPKISNHCYTISPLIKVKSGLLRIESYVESYVNNMEHQWALESIQLLKEETMMIHHFYEDSEEETDMNKEIEEVTARLQPQITFDIINGGILYLTENFST